MSAVKRTVPRSVSLGGFTFLEIMLVVALIGIVFAALIPMVGPSIRERRLRETVEAIAEQVRAERYRAQLEGRRQVLEIRRTGLGVPEEGEAISLPREVELSVKLPGDDWQKPAGQQWEFSPTGLVTPWTVRLEEGDSWIEADFDILTGRVADERYAL